MGSSYKTVHTLIISHDSAVDILRRIKLHHREKMLRKEAIMNKPENLLNAYHRLKEIGESIEKE